MAMISHLKWRVTGHTYNQPTNQPTNQLADSMQ